MLASITNEHIFRNWVIGNYAITKHPITTWQMLLIDARSVETDGRPQGACLRVEGAAYQMIDDQIEGKGEQDQAPPGHLHPNHHKEAVKHSVEDIGKNNRRDNAG